MLDLLLYVKAVHYINDSFVKKARSTVVSMNAHTMCRFQAQQIICYKITLIILDTCMGSCYANSFYSIGAERSVLLGCYAVYLVI